MLPTAAIPAPVPPAPASDDEPPRTRRWPAGFAGKRPSFGQLVAAAVPVAVLVAVLSSGLTGAGPDRGAPRTWGVPTQPGPSASGAGSSVLLGAPALPSRLAFVTGGLDGNANGHLEIVEGAGTGPYAPRAGRTAVSFTWSPDGSHLAVIDSAGGLRLLPEGVRIRGPVRDVAFSHDGRYLAICRGAQRPWLAILEATSLPSALVPGFRGCDPAWSSDDTYVSYTVPGSSGTGSGRRFALNTHLNVRFELPGAGPLVWAPAGQYVITPVTTLTPDCASVQTMDPRGGRAHVIASIPNLPPRPLGSTSPCPVTMIAWSADARWIAVSITPGHGSPDRVIAFEPRTHVLVPLPVDELGLTPTSLSWSPTGEALIVGGLDAHGRPLLLEAVPPGDRSSQWIAADDASWSPDGEWILGHDAVGWAAFRAVDPNLRVPLSAIPATAPFAMWCCPAADVVRVPPPADAGA